MLQEALLSPENLARLREAIKEYDLQAAEEQITANTVECATLVTTVPEDYARVGTSRYGGVPDLPEGGALWPESEPGKFYNFYLQLNLADVPDFVGNVLPKRGMLYCFMADYDDAIIVYADVEPSTLVTMDEKSPDELFNEDDSLVNAYQIEARAAIDVPEWFSGPYGKIEDALNESEDGDASVERYNDLVRALQNRGAEGAARAGKLLGQPAYIGYDPDESRPDRSHNTLLLMLNTEDNVGVIFGDAGYTQLFVPRAALATLDFSSVEAWLESS